MQKSLFWPQLSKSNLLRSLTLALAQLFWSKNFLVKIIFWVKKDFRAKKLWYNLFVGLLLGGWGGDGGNINIG